MKKIVAKLIYKILKPFITVEVEKCLISHIMIGRIKIFEQIVDEKKFSEFELLN